MNQINTPPVATSLRLEASSVSRPRPTFERRERGFGVGYGNSSGYASDRRYTPKPAVTRFRFT
jgi:hypothetical protein